MSTRARDPLAAGREVLTEGSACLARAAEGLGEDFLAAVAALAAPESMTVVTGVGKSGHIGNKVVASLVSTGHRAAFMHPQEALHGDLAVARDATLAILLSHSGSTEELMVLAPALREFGARIVTITAHRNCALARHSDWIVETLVDAEAGLHRLAPTSSSTTTLSLCDAMMIASLNLRGFTPEEFRRFHPGGLLGKKLKTVAEVMTPVAALPWLKPDDTIWDVLEAISLGRRGFAVVSEAPRSDDVAADAVGVISDGDIRQAARDRAAFGSRTAADIMTRRPKAIAAEAMMFDALHLMEENRYTFLLVTDAQGRLAGAVHMHDIVASDLDIAVRADRRPGAER
jgi:arabinose-5-phosphate isomerase